jgi:hypothetical protein
MSRKANEGDIGYDDRLTKLEKNVDALTQIAAHQATGLDKLSKAVEAQTGTLSQLLETTENNTEILNVVAGVVKQLSIANQETQALPRTSTMLDSQSED